MGLIGRLRCLVRVIELVTVCLVLVLEVVGNGGLWNSLLKDLSLVGVVTPCSTLTRLLIDREGSGWKPTWIL